MTVAPTANITTAPFYQSFPERRRDGVCKPTNTDDKDGDHDSKAEVLYECFEPFVQLASWGNGRFDPLAQFASGALHLGGGGMISGDESEEAWSLPPAAPANTSKDLDRSGRTHVDSILTRDGSMDIVSAGGVWQKRNHRQLLM